jgi:hypothetical protein
MAEREADGAPPGRHPVRHDAQDVDVLAASASYRELIERFKQRIRESQARAARVVNTELVMLYWSIGREILDQQRASGWGDDIVGRIAQDLAADTGSQRGFSRRNLFYMRRLRRSGRSGEKVRPLAAQLANRLGVPCSSQGSGPLSVMTLMQML